MLLFNRHGDKMCVTLFGHLSLAIKIVQWSSGTVRTQLADGSQSKAQCVDAVLSPSSDCYSVTLRLLCSDCVTLDKVQSSHILLPSHLCVLEDDLLITEFTSQSLDEAQWWLIPQFIGLMLFPPQLEQRR